MGSGPVLGFQLKEHLKLQQPQTVSLAVRRTKVDSPVCAAAEVDDVKLKAVNEMMERIKHGVVLRPVKSQESKVRRPEPHGREDKTRQVHGSISCGGLGRKGEEEGG